MQAMLKMTKIDIATLKRAYNGHSYVRPTADSSESAFSAFALSSAILCQM